MFYFITDLLCFEFTERFSQSPNGTEETVDYKNYDSSKYFRSSTPEFYSYDGIRNSTSSFEFEKAMIPINSSDFMYDEPVIFIGKDDEATLLYEPTKVHTVWNYAKTIQYTEGIDYIVEGNKIRLTENSSMKYWDKNDFYSYNPSDMIHPMKLDGTFMRYSEGIGLLYEYLVSYSHKPTSSYRSACFQGGKINNTVGKIRKGEDVNIAFLGDSITVGAGPLYLFESYVELLKRFLANYMSSFKFENISVGGSTSDGALSMANEISFVPDLVCIAYGMNDIFSDEWVYINNIEKCIRLIHEKFPKAEIILISNMLPNPEIKYIICSSGRVNQITATFKLEKSLIDLEERYPFVVLTPMTTISFEIYNIKKDCSVLGNNYNHPNGFLHRVYAQEILNTLFDDYYSESNPNKHL